MKAAKILASVSVLAMVMSAGAALAGSFEKTATGIVVKPDTGAAKEVRLEVMSDSIIHVLAVDDPARQQMPSLMTVATPEGAFTVSETKKDVTLKTGKASAVVSLETGLVTFYNAAGKPVLTEKQAAITPVTIEGQSFVATRAQFNTGTKEAFYGLGQHQNAQMNLNGEDVELRQHNMDVGVPFVLSDMNYGVLWDNNSVTRFGNPTRYGLLSRDLKLTTEDGKPGLTAKYYVDGKLILTRVETDINYQYLKDVAEYWPKDAALSKASTQGKSVKVVWDGAMTSDQDGVHKLRMYSSDYATLKVGDKTIFDNIWRQGWNPWYHNFETSFTKGKPVKLHVEWKPSGGMISMHHNNPQSEADKHSLSLTSEAGTGLNYYFIASDSLDGVIGGYRHLTGQAPMMPKWAYGFWQSRQRYETQDQLLGVLKTYRDNKWPIDNIVQDWFYWPEDQWGSHDFDPKRFPDPKGMVDEVHKNHAHVMFSIWGKFYANTDNYKEFEKKGYMWTQNVKNGTRDWVGAGYLNSHYSPYNQEARDIYYRQLKDKLIPLGIDAWWMDNTEPDVNSNERIEDFAKLITPTQMGPGAIVHNAYALMNTKAMYDGLKVDQPDTRQFILTRSGFAGVQRNASAVWSGDIVGTWANFHDQISAGVQMSMSGIPNWTHDIGGYAQETRFQGSDVGGLQENRAAGGTGTAGDLKEWRELNQRWFQFGAFSPLFRSHGEGVKREINEISPAGSDMRANMVSYLELRYRLMPYIYATASDIYYNSGTIMRGFAMDFPNDAKAKNVSDEYMFGKSFLVAPVTAYEARSRDVYLPAGAGWYNYYTGERFDGGASITVKAPLDQIPLFVKAGSVVPIGPVTQYVDEKPDAPITINVYTGADGSFSFYEDDGVSNGYVRGEFSRIPLNYNDKTGELTIGARSGSYKGMVTNRTFRVRFVKAGVASTAYDAFDKDVVYTGAAVVVKR
ncbi:glycoside hydrolase family 31 protein [Asticcacaulis benevestitus]|uniref:Alpha-xylosidase n=1 Tax=Asticcacaulis benevestitus DSM 16100 = ATCC BAA-896 TaxID=1121022 RepID=V4PVB5_9CAUL|nr:TIM-barrel domain-containing protein [Asticcacaulis benevestitus]ESQ92306.1 alpha-xylosidase [Asticcacaulis benevestitus DSM 16100 = ATCC BAA-896]